MWDLEMINQEKFTPKIVILRHNIIEKQGFSVRYLGHKIAIFVFLSTTKEYL